MKQKIIIGIVCLFIGLVIGSIAGWVSNGWRLNAKIESTSAEHAKAIQEAEKKAREKEQEWQASQNKLQAKYEEEKKDAESKIADLRRRVQSGTMRVSVPATACTVSKNSGTGVIETRAELDEKIADDLISIATDGDAAIRELNLCVDKYNNLRKEDDM